MKKAVVTGGAGFIGSHLVAELAQRDYSLTILDDLSSGQREKLKPFLKNPNVKLVEGSITDLPLLQKVFQGADYIYHLAAFASVPRSVVEPRLCHDVNNTGTLNVLIAAKDNGVQRVVNASSCAIYGDAPGLPKKENMPINPLSPYAVTKLAAEHYCEVFRQAYQLSTVSLRFFNIYGPGQSPDSDYAAVIPKFIKIALAGQPLEIYGDGKATRDFTYVKDAVNVYILAAESDATGVINVGYGQAVTVNELAKLVNKLTGNTAKTIYKPARTGDIVHSLADASKARAFGYRPRYTLEAGLKEMMGGMKA
jgi:UDP-glucose 4-epimerase